MTNSAQLAVNSSVFASALVLAGASAFTAGPWITSPLIAKREPWHGQSQLFSASFH